ncbi:MAG: hypothetical protein NWE96_05445 [Candidatus Bathyarchaeota archaeon]|nr:hypothetical protein [Candidatus Bathyarchaeota archaeon]
MSRISRVKKYLIPTTLIALIVLSATLLQLHLSLTSATINSNPYVGIAFCGNTSAEAKTQIDRTKTYTNLFILDIGRSTLSRNETAVMEICDYAVANGQSVIVNLGINSPYDNDTTTWFWEQDMTAVKQNWTQRWGNKFLGVYYNDEPGGIQLDGEWGLWYQWFGEHLNEIDHSAAEAMYQIYLKMLNYVDNGVKPTDYNMEADFFINEVIVKDPGMQNLTTGGIPIFTSDYCLYWWDYIGGYDVMFAELGWNASVAQQIAQVKGAARLMDKEWGAMITWKYYDVPFLDSGEKIYSQMLTAYQAGAKYIVIFNYAKDDNGNTAAAMIDEHYLALERFWNDIHSKPYTDLSKPEAVLVLPHNYGWGMREPDDKIWGFWNTDDNTEQIAIIMGKLLARYGASLDIVFEDEAYPVSKADYKSVYYWNQTLPATR